MTVALGAHSFGATRTADARVADAPWGDGVGQAGLLGGPTSMRIGPSSFDVSRDGTVALLDEMNDRVERWRGGALVGSVPVEVAAATSDFAVGAGGTMYVIDGRSAAGDTPLLRTFAPDGLLVRAHHIAERTWSQLRIGPRGPIVQQSYEGGHNGFGFRPVRDVFARECFLVHLCTHVARIDCHD